MTSRKLRVGIVGAGGVARKFHVPGWKDNPDVEIAAIVDVNEQAVRTAAAEDGIPQWYTDYREMLRQKDIDVADICTPNLLHTQMVVDAFAAGKHVICEKPLAVAPAEIVQMIEARDKAGKMLMVAQNNRYRGISIAIKRWVSEGNLGQVYYGRAWAIRRNLLPTAAGFICRNLSGGGPCMDIGVHALDLAMWLMGFPEPVTVSGSATTQLAKTEIIPGAWGEWNRELFDVEDFACGIVRFSNGAMLSLESSWLAHTPQPEDMSCMILGTKAGIGWPSGSISTAQAGTLIDATIKPVLIRPSTHTSELWDFYDALMNGKPSPVTAEESLKVIKILDGVYRSQNLGREVEV